MVLTRKSGMGGLWKWLFSRRNAPNKPQKPKLSLELLEDRMVPTLFPFVALPTNLIMPPAPVTSHVSGPWNLTCGPINVNHGPSGYSGSLSSPIGSVNYNQQSGFSVTPAFSVGYSQQCGFSANYNGAFGNAYVSQNCGWNASMSRPVQLSPWGQGLNLSAQVSQQGYVVSGSPYAGFPMCNYSTAPMTIWSGAWR